MCTGGHGAALVWLLQQAGGAAGAVGAQGLMVLLSQALHPLKGSHNQEQGTHLLLGVRDVLLEHSEGLQDASKSEDMLL